MEKKQKRHARSKSFSGGGAALASFLKSTVASFSSTFPSTSTSGGNRTTTRSSFNHRNAFSGPIVSIVPPEARVGGVGARRNNNKRTGYVTPEPSSPKVSCIGQIKRSNSRRQKKVNPTTNPPSSSSSASCGKNGGACPLPPRPPATAGADGKPACKPRASLVKRMSFFRRSRSRSRSSSRAVSAAARDDNRKLESDAAAAGRAMAAAAGPGLAPPVPAGLGQMKRFTSGRAAFQDFDWQEERRTGRDRDDDEDDGFVAHSAPLVLGGGVVATEPRKETVNLYRRRRPMGTPPTPLQLP